MIGTINVVKENIVEDFLSPHTPGNNETRGNNENEPPARTKGQTTRMPS